MATIVAAAIDNTHRAHVSKTKKNGDENSKQSYKNSW